MSEEKKLHKYKLGAASLAALREDLREIQELRGLLQVKMQGNKRMTDVLLQDIHGVDRQTLDTHIFDTVDEPDSDGNIVTYLVLTPRPQQK